MHTVCECPQCIVFMNATEMNVPTRDSDAILQRETIFTDRKLSP